MFISVNYLKEKRIIVCFKIQTHSEYNLLKVFQLTTFIGQTKTEALYDSIKKDKSILCLFEDEGILESTLLKENLLDYQNNRPRIEIHFIMDIHKCSILMGIH